ncbi:MAG: hypothetical protein HQL82_02080 [Magnetococcales bacterium]|nr:hypothetical protein [Magnetococcales bacterium]
MSLGAMTRMAQQLGQQTRDEQLQGSTGSRVFQATSIKGMQEVAATTKKTAAAYRVTIARDAGNVDTLLTSPRIGTVLPAPR